MPISNLKYCILSLFLLIALSVFGQKNETLLADSSILCQVEYVNIVGNEKTRERIIERELSFTEGEQYTNKELEKLINESYKNLVRLSLFNYVTIEKSVLEYDRIGIVVIVEERWFTWPQFSIINNDRNFNTWWKTRDFSILDYRMAVRQNNVFGLNHTLKFELSYGYTRELSLGYQNISFGKLQKHFFDWRVHLFKQYSAFYKSVNDKSEIFNSDDEDLLSGATAMVNYSFRPRHKSTHSWAVSYNTVKIADTLLNAREDFLSDNNPVNRYVQLMYNYILDNRDDSGFPLSGNRLYLSIVKQGFGLSKEYPVNLMFFYTNFKQFYKIVDRLYAAHSLSIKKAGQKKTTYYYKKGLGYIDYLRGFEYYVVEAEDFLLAKNTLNFELLPKTITNLNFIPIKKFKKIHYSIFLNTFFDIGYSHEKDEEVIAANSLTNKLLYSGGVGVNVVTYYDKVFRLEYSLNSLGEGGFFIHFKASI